MYGSSGFKGTFKYWSPHQISSLLVLLCTSMLASCAVMIKTSTPTTASLFGPHIDFATGTNPSSVAIADINGDGKPDLIVTNANDKSVSILMNTTAPGAIRPSFAPQRTFATGSDPCSVAVADVNGDGKPDLIVGNAGDGTISVLLNTTEPRVATPSFAAQQTFTAGNDRCPILAEDMNDDDKPDIIVVNDDDVINHNGLVSVLLNEITPGAMILRANSFTTLQSFRVGNQPSSLAVADINGDGKPDLIVANSNSSTVSMLLNTTASGAITSSFAPQQSFQAGMCPVGLTSTDLNDDGKPDLIVINCSTNSIYALVNTTVRGAATSSFSTYRTYSAGIGPISIAAADLNGDDKPDLIVVNHNSNNVSVFLNTTPRGAATPTFAVPLNFATGDNPQAIITADINNDGKPDLIVANWNGKSVSVLLNTYDILNAPHAKVATAQIGVMPSVH